MEEMLHIFTSVEIKPINSEQTFSFLNYYDVLPEFTRMKYDGQNVQR